MKEYYESILPQFERDWLSLGFSAQQVQTTMEAYRAQVSSLDAINLLALLRTFPIGITSLLSGPSPEMTPMGAPLVLQVGPLGNIFLLMLAIVLAGWIGGALYYLWVASLVLGWTTAPHSKAATRRTTRTAPPASTRSSAQVAT